MTNICQVRDNSFQYWNEIFRIIVSSISPGYFTRTQRIRRFNSSHQCWHVNIWYIPWRMLAMVNFFRNFFKCYAYSKLVDLSTLYLDFHIKYTNNCRQNAVAMMDRLGGVGGGVVVIRAGTDWLCTWNHVISSPWIQLCHKALWPWEDTPFNEEVSNDSPNTWGPFHYHGLTLIAAWISKYIHYEVWGEITCPFPNVAAVEVWEWKSNPISHITAHVIAYPWKD